MNKKYDFKKLAGKKVILKPTGNNARQGSLPFCEGEVTKVARVNIWVKINGYEKRYRIAWNGNNSIHDDCNGGYMVFESMDKYNEHLECEQIVGFLSERFRYPRDYMGLSVESLRKIKEIVTSDCVPSA